MEYQVSARKYRPQTFSAVVGQTALTQTLRNAVSSGKLAHAFLFCGPRGVGKTTCARIFAKTINCLHPTPEGEACGECESCTAFQEQRSYNIFELDAASNNSVENIKQLMEQTRIPPQVGRYKVFIIDEVHMLSATAFNAFLKTLEEPPSYVIFILATTEKNKLLPTILSRCQIYDFDRMSVADTVAHLRMVAEREGYTCEDEALEIIAEKADGGMRDALSIFDQAASFCQGDITREKVIRDLNLLDVENYFTLTDLCLANKSLDVMLLLNNMLGQGMDGGAVVTGLAAHLRNVMMARDPQTIPLLEASKRYSKRYEEQAKACPAAFLFKALQVLTRCDLDYKQSSAKRLLVEIALIEVAQLTQPDDDTPASPRKGRRLKSLFKNITPRQPQAAEQVAAAVAPHTIERHTDAEGEGVAKPQTTAAAPDVATAAVAPSTPTPAKPAAGRPRLAAGALGSTFSTMFAKSDVAAETDEPQTDSREATQFTADELRREWLAMCNRMAKTPAMVGLATSMRNLTPVITTYPDVEVVVANSILLEQLNGIHSRIRATLAKALHNGAIQLTLRLAEGSEVKPVLTKRELYEKLRTEVSQVAKLAQSLGLELV